MVRLRVKELAEERGISLSKLSRIADVSYKVVQRMWRNPEDGFNSKSLERVAHALGVSMGDWYIARRFEHFLYESSNSSA